MKLEKISLGGIYGLMHVLKRPFDGIEFSSPGEMISLMKKAKEKITVHHYSAEPKRGEENCLLDTMDLFSQIYIALSEGRIHCCISGSRSSGRREAHNQLIDFLLADKELRKNLPTMVLATHRGNAAAYYYHERYAYVNHDIGSNYEKDIAAKLQGAKLPFSFIRHNTEGGLEVVFENKGQRTIIYKALRQDAASKRFAEKLKIVMHQ